MSAMAKGKNASELVRGMLAAQRSELVESEQGARLGKEPEYVHRMRVATRRARAMLRTADGVLEPERKAKLCEELAWLGGVLGAVRDLDVLAARLKGESEALEPAERVALKPLFARLGADRRKARNSLTRTLKGARYRKLLEELAEAAVGASPSNEKVNLEKRAERQFQGLVKAMNALEREPSDDELHRVRKLGKRARYAAELAASQLAKPGKRFVVRAKAFQDVTGEHQDAVVAEERLRTVIAEDGAQAFAAGRLAERERARRAAARERLPTAWKELERAGHKIWS